MSARTVAGVLDQAALARLHFQELDREQQAAGIRGLAADGYGDHAIACATGLSVELIRRVIGEQRGKWMCGRWYPQWRLEELADKYRNPPDVEEEEEP